VIPRGGITIAHAVVVLLYPPPAQDGGHRRRYQYRHGRRWDPKGRHVGWRGVGRMVAFAIVVGVDDGGAILVAAGRRRRRPTAYRPVTAFVVDIRPGVGHREPWMGWAGRVHALSLSLSLDVVDIRSVTEKICVSLECITT
jgi:hypothetical protein